MRYFFLLFFLLNGCGYSFQNSKNDLFLKKGIEKIFIKPVVNNTYKPGVESVIYNAWVRSLLAHKKIVLVQSQASSDALLEGYVDTASYISNFSTKVSALNPIGLANQLNLPTQNFSISTEYLATLECHFILVAAAFHKGEKEVIWKASFIRKRPFPAANQVDVPGTTSVLINESEFDRSLFELSKNMIEDAHESMLALF